ncbi:DUF6572 domain-containing protein [Bosea sp. OK403]|uniref:DUF6572 domain-containing protein n=1 Tax=Bosea sp. OK403 TaxID=1855286 RepID=UPI000B859799|nr:DUF6572 domain-containing protein [Bosea sp. OK403]
MSIEQTDKVDFVNLDRATRRVVLTISDHLDWSHDEGSHLLLLQEKLNSYLSFIESGEIVKKFPDAQGLPIAISIVGRFSMSEQAKLFFAKARESIESAGFFLEFKLYLPH